MSAPPKAPPPQAKILDLITGFWAARAVAAVARLGVADQLAKGPRTAAELAPLIGANRDALYRLLRAMTSIGVLTQDAGGRFDLTPVGNCLRSGIAGSMRASIASELDTAHWQSWGHVEDCIRTGQPAFQKLFGMSAWDYYRTENPDEGRLFSENMTAMSGAEMQAILAAYSFAGARLIVDVGGAHGAFLAAVLGKVPQARGVLFDRPEVVELAGPALQEAGVAGRVERVSGNFFESVPTGGDLYLLKHILHDWTDDECVSILRCIRKAMVPAARVVVAELPILEGGSSPFTALVDVNMLVMVTGKERTPEEYAELFRRAGLELASVTPTESPIALLEARAAPGR